MSTVFVEIGRQPRGERLVDLLLECHERLRQHLQLAVALGTRDDVPASEVVETCLRCERYFKQALPLHIQDEEQSILPRLQGRDALVDYALEVMEREHSEHAPLIALQKALRGLRGAPEDAARRDDLLAAAEPVARGFADHLRKEEEIIFPAIETLLSRDTQALIVGELRARRA